MFDTWTLILSLVFSSIGLGYFMYGRKQANVVAQFSGFALMVYPYFIENKYAVLIVGVTLMSLPKMIKL